MKFFEYVQIVFLSTDTQFMHNFPIFLRFIYMGLPKYWLLYPKNFDNVVSTAH